jgi:alpha-tubulin suppressor-like RCC1 family protein
MNATQHGIFTTLTISSRSTVILVLAAALVLGGNAVLRAQPRLTDAQILALRVTPPSLIPQSGNFWSVSRPDFPPYPNDPFPDLPVYLLPDGTYLFDDSTVVYPFTGPFTYPTAARSLLIQSSVASQQRLASPMLNETDIPSIPDPTNSPPAYTNGPPQLLAPGTAPTNGTFWMLVETNWPSFPFNPCPDCDVYALSDGTYLVDDTGFIWPQPSPDSGGGGQAGPHSYTNGVLELEITGVTNSIVNLILHGTTSNTLYTILSRENIGPNVPWKVEQPLVGADGQTPVQIPTFGYPSRFFWAHAGTEQLRPWLQVRNIANGYLNLILHGTIPGTNYVIRSIPSLMVTNVWTNWGFEGVCPGTASQYWTPVSVSLNGRQSLFLSAQAGVDSDGDGMPDWWELLHGLNPLDPSDANDDPDGDGQTNLQAYLANGNPHNVMVVAWGNNSSGQCDVPTNLVDVVAVAAGADFSLALKKDGTVVAWGGSAARQTNVWTNVSNAVSLSANWYDAAVVRGDGTVMHWGASTNLATSWGSGLASACVGYDCVLGLLRDGQVAAWGQGTWRTSVPGGLSNVTALAAGANHSVAVLADGTVRAWGVGGNNLGWGLTNVPTGLTDGVNVAAGMLHTLVLRRNTTVAAWGNNADGQTNVPPGLTNVVAVTAGLSSSLALRADGSLRVWGDLAPGVPAGIPPGLSNVLAVGAGQRHFLAVRSGRLGPIITEQPQDQVPWPTGPATFRVRAASLVTPHYQWQFKGADISGANSSTLTVSNSQANNEGTYQAVVQNGAGSVTSAPAGLTLATPPVITYPTNTVNLWVRPQQVITLTVQFSGGKGAHFHWQHNGTNITEAADADTYSLTPLPELPLGSYAVIVSNLLGPVTSACWVVRSITSGSAVAWGADDQGQSDCLPGLTNVIALAAGHWHSVALREDGAVFAWGNSEDGKTSVPTNASDVVSIACGTEHTLALKADGTVVAWGRDNSKATEVPGDLANVVAIAAGGTHNLAVQTNGNLRAWGMDVGEMPANLTNVTGIAAGLDFNLALQADGTVVAWGGGTNNMSRTNVPTDLTNVVAVSAGDSHGLALKSDGTVVAWGDNSAGQTNVPPNLTNAMGIAAGSRFSMALRNDGTVVTWGDNTLGQTSELLGLAGVKSIAAGGDHALAVVFSPLVQYQVDVSKDLLLIYNTNSTDSRFVKDYYLAHRPMVSGANVLGIGCSNRPSFFPDEYTNNLAMPVFNWLMQNPTKRPQYVVLFLGIPWRVNTNALVVYDQNATAFRPSVQYQLATWCAPGWQPFVTAINMADAAGCAVQPTTNACVGYINKLVSIAVSNSPGKLVISASMGTYGNTNYYFDDSMNGDGGLDAGNDARDGVLAVNPTASVQYTHANDYGTNLAVDITSGANVAGYFCHGIYSAIYKDFPAKVKWAGSSSWWIIETVESYNGQPCAGQSDFYMWFSAAAFGGTNYSNMPVGAVTQVDEPGRIFVNDPYWYFGLWEAGKNFAICAWKSAMTPEFQAVGDPLVTK